LTARFTQDEIRSFWNNQAAEHGQSPSASWSDHRVIEMEIREITKHLEDGDRVLDVGCGNGYSAVQLASARKIRLRGLDFVPAMIAAARERAAAMATTIVGSVEFDVGDITQLNEPSASYDKVVVIRVLINLGTWARQLEGLKECVRVLRPGGTLLLSEATVQGWKG
jgi:ubiquinone/menaquinone biosynthesis C-methylase UbiE